MRLWPEVLAVSADVRVELRDELWVRVVSRFCLMRVRAQWPLSRWGLLVTGLVTFLCREPTIEGALVVRMLAAL